MKSNTVLIILLLVFFSFKSNSQVVINEIQTSNLNTITDEFGSNDDWIELYNASAIPVDLSGFKLSDNLQQPDKFTFPPFILPSNNHVLVFASGFEKTEVGGHWETAINATDTWKYQVNLSAPADTNWRNLSFNTNAWISGPGGIGYSDGDDNTTIAACVSMYMRKNFSISDTSKIADAILNIDYDDAFVAYINGVEIARANIGTTGSRPAWNAISTGGHEAVMYQGMNPDSFMLDMNIVRSAIINGPNVLAIEIHQTSNTVDMSSIPFLSFKMKDATSMFGPTPAWFTMSQIPDYFHADFKLSKTGESVYLFDGSSNLLDSIMVTSLHLDNSYERNPDGSSQWCVTNEPTPDTTNTTGACNTGYATIPLFSLQSGFYPNAQILTLSTNYPGGVIHYTTNGNTPDGTSPIYSGAIVINTTTSVRAAVFALGVLSSAVVTNTYLISFDCKLPVYVLTTDSANLWDYNTGIFVEGPNAQSGNPHWGANYWMGWEKPVSLEYFDKDKNRAFRFDAGLRVTGGWSRADNQKPLEISMGDRFGLGELNYPLLSEKPWVNKFNDFVLHTSGNDRGVAHMRDPLMERLLVPTYVDHISFEPCLLFINGQQWGVYYTRENDDDHFIEENYGISKDDIDLLKESYFYTGMEVKKGSDSAFFSMYNYAMNTSPADVNFLSTMNTVLDIQNMVDYFAAETYYPNGDWMGGGNNNLKLWRQRSTNGKFRYISYDFDFGFGLVDGLTGDILSEALAANPHNYQSDLFARLIQNPEYKNYFINRYADLINTIWLPSNVNALASAFEDSLRHDMHYQYENGWSGGDTNQWKSNVADMLNFATQRPSYARDIIQNDLGMTSQVTLTLQVSPPGSGRIQISTITPVSLPWSGVYFNGNPVTITAIPNPGYTFDHWHSNVVITTNDYNQSTSRNFTSSDQITAYFNGSPMAAQITISELNYNSDSARDAGDWIELHNLASQAIDISGWKIRDDQQQHVYTFPANSVITANGYLVVAEDLQKFTLEHPSVTNVAGELGFNFGNGGDQVRLYDYRDTLYLSMEYADDISWPQGADGAGYTLELLSSAGNLSDGANWFDGCLGGSPGMAYSPGSATAVALGDTVICGGGSVTIQANTGGGLTYQWENGNQIIAGATNSFYDATVTGNYSVVVTSNGCAAVSDTVDINVYSGAADPIVASITNCGGGIFTLNAVSADSVFWYDAPNGNLLSIGDSYTTPFLSGTTVYYVQASNVCRSAFVTDSVIISSTPQNPAVTNVVNCGNGSVNLDAISANTVNWYDAPNGNLLGSGNTFVTPVLTATTVYYAQAANGCVSAFIADTVLIIPVPADPGVNGILNCGGGTFNLNASSADSVFWYDAPNGNLLASGNSFNTPFLTATTVYYVQASNICTSAFVADSVIIVLAAADPVVTPGSSCGAGSVSLSASSADTLFWYDSIGGNLLWTGSIYQTPPINVSTTYYVSAGSFCPSNYVPVTATVFTLPNVSLGNDTIVESPAFVVVSAGTGFASYLWSTTETTQSIIAQNSGAYWVIVTDANGCTATDTINVLVTVGLAEADSHDALHIYPNPVHEILALELNSTNAEDLHLIDVTGRVVWHSEISAQSTVHVDVSGYSKGIYLLKMQNDKTFKSYLIVVE
ncbi:MAG: CotH kinase family protein [Bacteroidetes bacterium]|nr:CotH kinase family protein [Bacteroidota bacterium]